MQASKPDLRPNRTAAAAADTVVSRPNTMKCTLSLQEQQTFDYPSACVFLSAKKGILVSNYVTAEGQSLMKGPGRLDIQLHDGVFVRRDRWHCKTAARSEGTRHG